MKPITLIILASIHIGCGTSANTKINDFFGIKMPESDIDYFEIVSYDERSGASYRQSVNMDPELYAWAELRGREMHFKIVNHSDRPVTSDYLRDQFILVTNAGNEYHMEKSRSIDYAGKGMINPKSEKDYILTMPSRFWDSQGMTVSEWDGAEFTENFWKGLNTINTQKDNLKLLKIILGSGDIIILKPVPRENPD